MTAWHDAIQASDLVRGGDAPDRDVRCTKCARWITYEPENDTGLCETCDQDEDVGLLEAGEGQASSRKGNAMVAAPSPRGTLDADAQIAPPNGPCADRGIEEGDRRETRSGPRPLNPSM